MNEKKRCSGCTLWKEELVCCKECFERLRNYWAMTVD